MGNRNNENADRDPGLERDHRRQEDRAWSPTSRSQYRARDMYQDTRASRGFYDQPSERRLSGGMRSEEEFYANAGTREGTNSISHRGKGPKGYSRSDERIRENVCDLLFDDARLDATEIDVTVDAGEVTLEGEVRDRESKRRAEDVALGCAGVRDVHNRLRLRASS